MIVGDVLGTANHLLAVLGKFSALCPWPNRDSAKLPTAAISIVECGGFLPPLNPDGTEETMMQRPPRLLSFGRHAE